MDDNCNAETLANDPEFTGQLLTGFSSAFDHDAEVESGADPTTSSFFDYQIESRENTMIVTICGKKTSKGHTMVFDWRHQKQVDLCFHEIHNLRLDQEISESDEIEIREDIVNMILKMSSPSVEST